MSKKKVVIDPGHGGGDSGAVNNGIIEKEYTLKISKYISKRLKELGIDNELTRNDDITLEPSDRINKVLSIYGDNKDIIVISNHINAGGAEIFKCDSYLRYFNNICYNCNSRVLVI